VYDTVMMMTKRMFSSVNYFSSSSLSGELCSLARGNESSHDFNVELLNKLALCSFFVTVINAIIVSLSLVLSCCLATLSLSLDWTSQSQAKISAVKEEEKLSSLGLLLFSL
jgi:hypothetical protein